MHKYFITWYSIFICISAIFRDESHRQAHAIWASALRLEIHCQHVTRTNSLTLKGEDDDIYFILFFAFIHIRESNGEKCKVDINEFVVPLGAEMSNANLFN